MNGFGQAIRTFLLAVVQKLQLVFEFPILTAIQRIPYKRSLSMGSSKLISHLSFSLFAILSTATAVARGGGADSRVCECSKHFLMNIDFFDHPNFLVDLCTLAHSLRLGERRP